MKHIGLRTWILMILLFSLGYTNSRALQSDSGRLIKLTLIPDYVGSFIQFDGIVDLGDPAAALDLTGLPLKVTYQWKEAGSRIWNITGVITGGLLVRDEGTKPYRLEIRQIQLRPDDRLELILPFVNLDYAEIRPVPQDPDRAEQISRQLTNFFSYSAGDAGLDIDPLVIPFTPITKKVDLVLVPLMGEALAGKDSGLRLAGQIHFEAIEGFDRFSRYCQITPRRLKDSDYRIGHLLYDLDFPSFFGPDVLNPIYQYKPTTAGLRSDFTNCNYDKEKGIGEVQAVFAGRVVDVTQSDASFPAELRGTDFPDGNYTFVPPLLFRGISGYEIRLGKITLAPGDTLTITIPNAQVQADNLLPAPTAYEDTGNPRIVYAGPMSFELSVPYIPQTQLYVSQFPSIIRPSIALLEDQLGNLFPFAASKLTWGILIAGFLVLALSRSTWKAGWLAVLGGLLILIGLFYGVRGSFGLLCAAAVLHIGQALRAQVTIKDYAGGLRKTLVGLAGLVIIALAVYLDSEGTIIFRGLSEPDLSPLTPLVIMIAAVSLFLLFYGIPKDAKGFHAPDLSVLVLFLVVLSLYDAFDKSLLSLLILFVGSLYIHWRAIQNAKKGENRLNKNRFGIELQRRLRVAFGNRLIPVAILILIVFAIVNELSTTFANEMQIALSPLLAPIVIPLLAFVSVFIAFASIAILFVLVYPFLPSRAGYIKATIFALFLFLVFFFGIGSDDRLISSLPSILVGRVIYYFSVPMLIGVYFDINEYMQKENKRLASEGGKEKGIDIQAASSKYFAHLRGILSTVVGILSLVAPSVYAFLSSQPVFVTYFSLLEKLVLLPI